MVPEVCDEQRIELPWFRHNSTHPGSSESSEARGSSDTQFRTNNASLGTGHGTDIIFEDAAGAIGNSRSATTGSEQIAMRDCGGPCAIAPTQEIFGFSSPDPANDSNSQKDCTCISCLRLSTDYYSACFPGSDGYTCRFPCCRTVNHGIKSFYDHEKSHYGQPGKYTCLERDCKVVTKNFGDLKRHDKAKHCTNPYKEQFPCPESWCKYSGNNGFARKDKLKSHYKNMHEGKLGPCKAGRVIKPATLKPKPQVSNLEGTAGKQKE